MEQQMTSDGDTSPSTTSDALTTALHSLRTYDHRLAEQLARIATAVLTESARNPSLRLALQEAVDLVPTDAGSDSSAGRPTGRRAESAQQAGSGGSRRTNRRSPGPWDPFVIFAEVGAHGLEERLRQLDLEQLRDIVAEHGMDADKLAMKWKDPKRVIDRIVERVEDRAGKGSAFRGE